MSDTLQFVDHLGDRLLPKDHVKLKSVSDTTGPRNAVINMQFRFVRLVHVFVVFACFTCSVSLSIQAQQPAADKNAGSISGRITVDGKPKAGLLVGLLATDATGGRRLVAKVTTD